MVETKLENNVTAGKSGNAQRADNCPETVTVFPCSRMPMLSLPSPSFSTTRLRGAQRQGRSLPKIRAKLLHRHRFYIALALTFNALVLFTSTKTQAQFIPSGLPDADLQQQLDIPLNNGTQSQEREQADFLMRLGGQAQRQGNYDKAIANWLQALEIYQQIGDFEGEGRTYDFIGVTYAKMGRYQKAEDALRRRVGVARTRQDFQGQIYGLNNLGTILLESGNPQSARETFTEALTIARSIQNRAGEGLSESNLGLVAAAEGKYFEAIKRYQTALVLRSRADDAVGEANTRNNLGDAYRAINLQKDALIAHQGALRVARDTRDVPNQFRALRGLVKSYSALGQYPVGLKILAQHRELAQREANRREELLSLRLAAELYRATGNFANAQSFYEEAISLASALGETQEEAFLRDDLSQIIYYRR
jgi:tetratricopeptide (TPR) repeat protein